MTPTTPTGSRCAILCLPGTSLAVMKPDGSLPCDAASKISRVLMATSARPLAQTEPISRTICGAIC
jgi:hypothetical protein